jgi:phosphomannomutase
MALMKSISGIRGTIGGAPGDNLTPVDIVKFTAAYATILGKGKKVIVGRDGRMSGEMVRSLVVNTLLGMGLHVIDLGMSTTPTVEMALS